jgi:hypothetical protein
MTNTLLPPAQKIPAAWYGPQMTASEEWLVHLDEQEIAEVETAVRAFLACSEGRAPLEATDFPLPRLAPKLQALRRELLDGRGFALLRGLPVQRWSQAEAAYAFVGLGAHLGNARSQNAAGHLLGHVRDVGLSSDDPNVRIYQTKDRQTFHTDSCDVVALLCLRRSRSGGESLLVSSTTIYNEMLRRRPDLAAVLFEPIATDRRGEVRQGQKPYFEIPVFSWHAGKLTAIYHRPYIESAQRFEEAPRLTDLQREALDLFDTLAEDSALNMSMDFQPGDMQFVHNHVLLHDRNGFEDWPDPAQRRHLLRLWLALPGARPLPEVFAQRYGRVTIGDRGGILLEDTVLRVPVEV